MTLPVNASLPVNDESLMMDRKCIENKIVVRLYGFYSCLYIRYISLLSLTPLFLPRCGKRDTFRLGCVFHVEFGFWKKNEKIIFTKINLLHQTCYFFTAN